MVKKVTLRCDQCRKKIAHRGFTCQCLRYFCSHHRYPFEHECSFNQREKNKRQIKKQNPKIEVLKVNPI
jgi:predicted nucleic acid binding AN1-type Zn finger protein